MTEYAIIRGKSNRKDGDVSGEYFDGVTEEERQDEMKFLAQLGDSWIIPGGDTPYWAPDLDPKAEYVMKGIFERMPDFLTEVLKSDVALAKADEIAAKLEVEYLQSQEEAGSSNETSSSDT